MTKQRGMTIIEMVISFGILLLVLGFATALFKQAFTHNTLVTENMSNEQQARIAMAKINNSISQASQDTNSGDLSPQGTPAPPVIGIDTFPNATATPAIAFYRVKSLAPANTLNVDPVTLAPQPSYKVHIISYDSVAKQVNEYVMNASAYGGASPPPTVIATNVTDFQVQQLSKLVKKGDKYEYRLSITINNIRNVATNVDAEKPYTLVDNVHIMR